MKKLYTRLNESVNNVSLDEGLFGWLGRNLVAKPVKWAGRTLTNRAKRKFSRSNEDDFNMVKGGYFTSDKGLDSINQRILDSELGEYIEKDSNGRVRFNQAKLKALKAKDPEMYNQILDLNKAIAQGNNASWLRFSNSRKNRIKDALGDLEAASILKGKTINPLHSDVLKLVSKIDPDLVAKYNAVSRAYNNLISNDSINVAGNKDELLNKQREALKQLSSDILKKDMVIRHNPSRYKPKPQDYTSATKLAINKKTKNNVSKEVV